MRIAIINSLQGLQVDLCPQLLNACGHQLLGLLRRIRRQTGSEILRHMSPRSTTPNPATLNLGLRMLSRCGGDDIKAVWACAEFRAMATFSPARSRCKLVTAAIR